MEMTKPSSESEDSQKKHVWGKFLKRYKNAPCAKDGVGLGGGKDSKPCGRALCGTSRMP